MAWSDAARRAAAMARRLKAKQKSARYRDDRGEEHEVYQLRRPTSRGHRFAMRSFDKTGRWKGTGEMGPNVKSFRQANELFKSGAYLRRKFTKLK